MNTFAVCFLLFASVVYVSSTNDCAKSVTGHCWRDYNGTIPSDALKGGLDTNKGDTYIGQAIHDIHGGILVPGKIYPQRKVMTYEWGYQEHIKTANFTILCTAEPESFVWIKTNVTELKNIKYPLVNGGFEPTHEIYIGRVQTDGELSPGKVVVADRVAIQGIHTTVNGRYVNKKAFEVLAYKPGYHWESFNGSAPEEAIIGSYSSSHEPIYVGRAKFIINLKDEILIPGKIFAKDNKMTFEWGGREHSADTFEILCSYQPERIQWVNTTSENINQLMKEKHLIVGGYESTFSVFIGREMIDNSLSVGKVIVTDLFNIQGLHTTVDGKYFYKKSFQVLVFNE